MRAPSSPEVEKFKDRGTLISFIYPAQNKQLLEALAARHMTVYGMECVPRISRAQVGILLVFSLHLRAKYFAFSHVSFLSFSHVSVTSFSLLYARDNEDVAYLAAKGYFCNDK